jgi:hypothetical protein
MLYTILGDKRMETYVRLFQKIKELQPALELESVMFDFETDALSAFKETFSESDIAGCFFHLSQNLWWQIQKIPGLVHLYGNRADVRLKCKSLLALSFVPPTDVQFAYEILQEEGFPPEMKPITDYWENTYVGRRLEGVVPSYAISMWNSFDRLNSDIPRTNNSLEAWHNAFQKTVDCHRPSLVKLLDKFQLEQNQSENFMLRYWAGSRSNESSKSKYFQLKKRLRPSHGATR